MAEVSNRNNNLVLPSFLAAAIALVFVGLVWASVNNESMMGGMMHQDESTGFPVGTYISLFGVLLVVVALILIIATRPREAPVAQAQPYVPYQQPHTEVVDENVTEEDMHRLTLRLLAGDERKMFRRIVDAGGEVLQKDLVAEGVFSRAKVTRLLDKLERKDLIVRERFGSTNLVRISKDIGK